MAAVTEMTAFENRSRGAPNATLKSSVLSLVILTVLSSLLLCSTSAPRRNCVSAFLPSLLAGLQAGWTAGWLAVTRCERKPRASKRGAARVSAAETDRRGEGGWSERGSDGKRASPPLYAAQLNSTDFTSVQSAQSLRRTDGRTNAWLSE